MTSFLFLDQGGTLQLSLLLAIQHPHHNIHSQDDPRDQGSKFPGDQEGALSPSGPTVLDGGPGTFSMDLLGCLRSREDGLMRSPLGLGGDNDASISSSSLPTPPNWEVDPSVDGLVEEHFSWMILGGWEDQIFCDGLSLERPCSPDLRWTTPDLSTGILETSKHIPAFFCKFSWHFLLLVFCLGLR